MPRAASGNKEIRVVPGRSSQFWPILERGRAHGATVPAEPPVALMAFRPAVAPLGVHRLHAPRCVASVSSSSLDTTTALAIERTLLAWIRTGIALMGFGFVVARFALLLHEVAGHAPIGHRSATASLTGVGLVGAGMAVNAWAGVRHARMLRDLTNGKRDGVTARGPFAITIASTLGGAVLVLLLLGVFGD